MSRTQSLLLIAGSLLVAALSSYTYLAKQNSPDRWYSQAQVEQGATLYLDYCAACHGNKAKVQKTGPSLMPLVIVQRHL